MLLLFFENTYFMLLKILVKIFFLSKTLLTKPIALELNCSLYLNRFLNRRIPLNVFIGKLNNISKATPLQARGFVKNSFIALSIKMHGNTKTTNGKTVVNIKKVKGSDNIGVFWLGGIKETELGRAQNIQIRNQIIKRKLEIYN
jgi:hypothetical protein